MDSRVRMYEKAFHEKALGETLHPGGLDLTQHALERSHLPTGSRVIDVGCGAGISVQYLRDLGYLAYGLDRSAELLQARPAHAPILPTLQADSVFLPLPTNGMDAILAECSLSVFSQTDRVLREFYRLLHKDGLLIISDLYARNPSGLADLRALLPGSCFAGAFIQEELIAQLAATGFEQLIWEDHSEALKSLAGGSVSALLCGATDCQVDAMDLFLSIVKAKPGYFLCIAKKGLPRNTQK